MTLKSLSKNRRLNNDMKLKHRLPPYANLPHLNCDEQELSFLKKFVIEYDNWFKTALNANSQLCRYHTDLTLDTYGDLLQINVTDSIYLNEAIMVEQFNELPELGNYKEKMTLAKSKNTAFSEHSYIAPAEIYNKATEFFDNLKEKFRSTPTRIRLVKLPSGKSITPHIDYDPSYAVRIIIPIVSDNDCLNLFWVKNKIQVANFQEGRAYFLNTGYRHAVSNFSKNARHTLMISLDGSDDLSEILIPE